MRSTALSLAIATAMTVFLAGCAEQRTNASSDKNRASDRELADEKQSAAKLKKAEIVGKELRGDIAANDATRGATAGEQRAEPQRRAKDDADALSTAAAVTVPAPVVTEESVAAAPPPPAEPKRVLAKPASIAPAPGIVAGMAGGRIATSEAPRDAQIANTEKYQDHADNPVLRTAETPVSTFSIDVDTGSYTNVRRMLRAGQLPPADAVRAEEFINYFDYAYAPPATRETPFSVTTELAAAPWNANRKLMLVGIKGYELPAASMPASNLVFLIDTSGSMNDADKLPLLREAFKQMVPNLRAQDRVSIVVYAGSAGLVLPPTRGDQHARIIAALDSLSAGGSTNGGQGIQLAYTTAKQVFIKNGINRVVLATDGDFNVGTTDLEALKTLVTNERKSGVALTTLGFGRGNYNDELSEQLADIGNGNHAYIDNLMEARKVLVEEVGSTLMTIAKDVKIQVEFNPRLVAEYRLIGYENRQLRREDFNNDKIDAGEIGAGHDVTALYELTLVGDADTQIDALRYAAPDAKAEGSKSDELAFVKLRYKQPDADSSQLISRAVKRSDMAENASERLRFAAAVAAFADSLRGGTHLGQFNLDAVARLADSVRGTDRFGYRAEFVELVQAARSLQPTQASPAVAISR
ncbi:vWA domain-containing protein [Tahibacter amnicola]|uniref:VWA domain-containing protein n=1 Tax=Tahibacter amnicola TaxID=2976241 RepID=A0ABY6BJ91_9GAMM|nr:VWA domain-containing protein [Tahibacter amnicola]UXI68681.1 VWA domain-containing protein [Tahibacter amnicola]